MLDILSIGDAKIDIYLQIPGDNPHFGLNDKKDKLVLSYGEKIVVDRYLLDVGGNATNSAVGFARLGLESGLCAEIGLDELSQKILNTLKTENINTQYLIQNKTEQTSISIALNYKQDRTLFTEHVLREHNFNIENINAKYIYLTSLGKKWENAYKNIYNHLLKNDTILGYNPGSVQLEHQNKFVLQMIEETDYLFVNKQEAEELLYGKVLDIQTTDNNIKKLLYGLKSLGARNIIITDGSNGSYSYSFDSQFLHLGIKKVDVVEKTGAGDAFSTAFMAAIIHGYEIKQALIWGALNSANVVEHVGAQQGLLHKTDLEKQINTTKLLPLNF